MFLSINSVFVHFINLVGGRGEGGENIVVEVVVNLRVYKVVE